MSVKTKISKVRCRQESYVYGGKVFWETVYAKRGNAGPTFAVLPWKFWESVKRYIRWRDPQSRSARLLHGIITRAEANDAADNG